MDRGNLPPLFPLGSPSSLFPIARREVSVSQDLSTVEDKDKLSWLSNESFSEKLIPEPLPIPPWYSEEIQVQHASASKPSDLLLHSPSKGVEYKDEDDEEEEEEEEKGKAGLEYSEKQDNHEYTESKDFKRKRDRERSHNRHRGKLERKKKRLESSVMDKSKGIRGKDRFVDIEMKEYQFDARGDRDNLAYDSLYRMSVPKFHRSRIRITRSVRGKPFSNIVGSRWEEDGANMDEKIRAEGRYWSAKYASLDRRKDFKRVQIITPHSKSKSVKLDLYSGDFISLEGFSEEAEPNYILREESWEDYVIRKTKDFNQQTRERPQDESLWIAFVNFQDELIKAASRKAAIQQAVEKKIAVLEKAMEFHPFSEDLWSLFLETSRKRDDVPTLISKWEKCLKYNPRSYKLWTEYLSFRKGEFSMFTESSLRKEYIRAIQTYWVANNSKEFAGDIEGRDEVSMEKDLVSLFMDMCHFEWQAGHHEFAIGLLQAQIDYSIFAPHIEVNEKSKKRLFKDFWDSGAPRIGEDGSTGWAEWLQKQEELIQAPDEDMEDEKDVGGGWTGWFEPPTKNVKIEEEHVSLLEDRVEENEIIEEEEIQEDEKYEMMLLERLGLSLKSEQESEIKDPETWKCWSEEEQRRDSLQWLPVHSSNLKAAHDEEIFPDAEEEDEQLQRAVLFEDVQECLFSLRTIDGQLEMIYHFTDFCDGPSVDWYCSNSMRWKQRMASLEHLCGPLLNQMGSSNILKKLVGGSEWMFQNKERCKFLANALTLLRPHFLNSLFLQEKLLGLETHRTGANDGARSLAKKLLKSDRQAVLLMGAYAHAEASFGNLEVARKVFDTTLASLNSQSKEAQLHAPILYECYAELELSQLPPAPKLGSSATHQKLLHILSCLGSGTAYTPYKVDNPTSSTQILKARHGFKEHLYMSRRRRDQGQLTDQIRAMISCAALFELLIDGFEAACSVFEESFMMGLPGKRQESLQFELLYLKYIRRMEQCNHYVKPAVLRDTICRGLSQYPNNPELLSAYIRCSSSTSCTNNLRRFFDDMLHKNPSIVIWLFAISVELRKPGSEARIRSLFEKALETLNSQQSVVLWRFYISFELDVRGDTDAARRIYFRAIHACPWSKMLWLDGFEKMSMILSAKELSDFQDIMREKELQLRTDVYEILLAKEEAEDEGL